MYDNDYSDDARDAYEGKTELRRACIMGGLQYFEGFKIHLDGYELLLGS